MVQIIHFVFCFQTAVDNTNLNKKKNQQEKDKLYGDDDSDEDTDVEGGYTAMKMKDNEPSTSGTAYKVNFFT